MTIQVPNPGTGNGATGDNEFVLWSKVKANFEDQSNAASRTVGDSPGSVMLVGAFGVGSSAAIYLSNLYSNVASGLYVGNGSASTNYPDSNASLSRYGAILRIKRANDSISLLFGDYGAEVVKYNHDTNTLTKSIKLLANTGNAVVYNLTTAAGANTVISSDGTFMRSTSSERYKDIIADLELDDTAYANAMQLAPIVYRSTAEADNPNYHYYSFSAEALGAYDPAFTLWRDTETVTDDEGSTSEQPLDERQAEGINLNAIVAFLHATNVKQGKLIAEQAKAIETLTKRIDDITVE
tara:strand:- start:3712 stop:4599 length:888 start_codon:yes stop_codon:yes gene_type:complete